jgi:hypothetical protein
LLRCLYSRISTRYDFTTRPGILLRHPVLTLLPPAQLVKELDITGGDDAAIGYYAGIIVHADFKACENYFPSYDFTGIAVFRCTGTDDAEVESIVGPHWTQAGTISRTIRYLHFDAMFWPLDELLEPCRQVCLQLEEGYATLT